MEWRLLVEERIARKYWACGVSTIIFGFKKIGFWSLQPRLLCIVGELAGEGSVAVAVGVNDS